MKTTRSPKGHKPPMPAKNRHLLHPKFKKEKIDNLTEMLFRRWPQEYFRPEFDEWRSAFTLTAFDENTNALFKQFDLDPSNPFHWRALLEAFTSEYVIYKGPRKKRRPDDFLELALDLEEIRNHLKGTSVYVEAADYLQKNDAYSDRYRSVDSDILRKRVKEVFDAIGPMDDRAIGRLRKLFPHQFREAFFSRAARPTIDPNSPGAGTSSNPDGN